jgi:hypothetical protein
MSAYIFCLFSDPSQTSIEKLMQKDPRRHYKIDQKQFKTQCEFCAKLKFERSSHCTQCNVCITRRDHHCDWIGRCVGNSNTQWFINQIIWTFMAGYLYMQGFINYYNNGGEVILKNPSMILPIYLKIIIYIYNFIACFGTFGVLMILTQQIYSVFNESSYNERRKNTNLEFYLPFCKPQTIETKEVIIFI